MDKDSPAHPHAAEDGNSSSDTQPIMTRDKMHDFVGLPTSKSKGLKRKFSCQSLSTQDSADVNGYAYEGLQDLIKESVTATSTSTNTSLTLKSRLLLPEPIPLLVRAQEVPSLEYDLHRLKIQRIGESHQHIYIPPMAKANLQAQDDDSFSLIDKVKEFLTSDREVMLILGDSGAGKSTFNRHLENQLWTNYGTGDPIPLHINLPAICNPENDMITKQLLMHGLTDEQIKEVKYHREFVVICDGYDESQLTVNLHKTNRLNRQGQWRAKMIISCRTQFLGSVYLDRFVPQGDDHYQHPAFGLFQEAVIAPFSKEQVEDYVTLYVSLKPRPWVMEDYMRMLTTIPNLMDLVKNPFLLTLSLEALPGVTKNQKDLTNIKISRAELYDHFVDQWFSVNIRRLQNSVLSKEDQVMLEQLTEAGFSALGVDYSTRLAEAIFDRHGGNPVIQYIHLKDQNTWKGEFFGMQLRVRLLRESSPLTRTGNLFRFIHRSMLEYFFSRYIYNPAMIEEGFDVQAETRTVVPHLLDVKGPLFQMDLLKEPSVIQFLCDRVKQSTIFEQILRSVIDQSKTNTSATTAATNAITILVRAGVSFNGADLRDVKICGADLSSGQFDSTQFQRADLAKTNFARSWLRQTDFSSANMKDVTFGELAYLEGERSVMACCFSPNGKLLGTLLNDGIVHIYDTLTWTTIHCLKGHSGVVTSIAFSPDSQRLASGSNDNTIQLWDSTSGEKLLIMEGHSSCVNSVAISPCGCRIASASDDKAVRLWDVQTGVCLFVLKGHDSIVRSVKYSPDGRQVISGSWDKTIRFWDSRTGEPGTVLNLHPREVRNLAYSPDERWIAVSYDRGNDLQLWDAASLRPGLVLSGHTSLVIGIDFSPNGQWIASSSMDHTVRLWDVSTGTLVSSMTGHTDAVNDVSFSPDGLHIASAAYDKKVRLWDVSSVWSEAERQSRRIPILDVVYSVDGQEVLSCSTSSMRQWNSLTGVPGPVLLKLPEPDQCHYMAFSPDGRGVAAITIDGYLRLWDFQDDTEGVHLPERHEWSMIIIYSPRSRWLSTRSTDGIFWLWDLYDHQLKHALTPTTGESFEDYAYGAVFSPTGTYIAVGYKSGTIRIFDPHTGDLLISKKLVDFRVVSLAYSPSGLQLALGTHIGSIHLWDLPSEKPTINLERHINWIRSIAYSTCGQWIASGGDDQTVQVWHRRQDTTEESWSCAATVQGFFGIVQKVIWNPLVPLEFTTACWDGSLRVWRISGSNGRIAVNMLWGSNLQMLCVTDMTLKDATGLSPIQQKLLLQRGAINGVLEVEE